MENLIQIKNWIYQIDPIWWKSLGILALVVIVLKVLIFFRFYGKFFVRGRGMLEEHTEKRGEICGRVISAGIWGFIIADLDYVYDALIWIMYMMLLLGIILNEVLKIFHRNMLKSAEGIIWYHLFLFGASWSLGKFCELN